MQYEDYSDEELIIKMRDGQQGISDYLVEKYKELVRSRARAMYLLGGEKDDLIQEGMIGLFKAIRDYDADKNASFHTFACICIDRQLYSAIQSYNRQKHIPLNSYISLSGEIDEVIWQELWVENPESIIIDQENAILLQDEIKNKLSAMESKVLDLYLKGYDYHKIAGLLGKSPKSADNALQRIRMKVRNCIEKYQNQE